MKPIHIAFAGGGTGGHLFPGLAVAEQLTSQVRRVRITFAGSGKEFERRHVTAAGFESIAVPCRPLPRRMREAASFVIENIAGYMAASRFLDEEHVDAVVGLGGYASVPLCRAAQRRRVPLVLLEQNFVPGRANRWLARWASLICTSFEETRSRLRCRCPVRVTGNPIRTFRSRRFCGSKCEQAGDSAICSTRQLLVLGGSGGARTLNENVPRALYKLGDLLAGCRIIHQTGEAGLEATRDLYRKLALPATVEPFLADLPELLAASELAVSRAGGTALAELSAAGVPAVLLPYPHAAHDHQRRNAEVFVAAGGAVLVDEREVTGRLDDHIAQAISTVLRDPDVHASMSAAMWGTARPSAAADVAGLIWSIVSSQARRGPSLAAA